MWIFHILIMAVFPMGLHAYTLKGVVCDSLTNLTVPYATLTVLPSGDVFQADGKGRFSLAYSSEGDSVKASALGYSPAGMTVSQLKGIKSKIKMSPTGVNLSEIVVTPKKEKYSKRNNPAVDLAKALRKGRYENSPMRKPYYAYDKYERITVGLNNISASSKDNLILQNFQILRDYIDTSEVTGRPILALSMREKASHYDYRHSPESLKETVLGVSQSGLDDFMDPSNMRTLYEDFFKDIDLGQNDIDILHNRFVSPLSRIAPDFYKFYITDTVSVDSVPCIVLAFVPQKSSTMGFTGKLYVEAGDTTMFIRKASMNVSRHINLNFIEGLHINQEFSKGVDGTHLPTRDDLIAEVALIPGTQGVFFRRNTVYSRHKFTTPMSDSVFRFLGDTRYATGYDERDSVFWRRHRLLPLSRLEKSIPEMTYGMRQNKLYKIGEGALKILVLGYVRTGKKSKFDFGPVNTLVSHNTLEGWRVRLGGMTTANLSPHIFARGYLAYGTRDHKLKYNAEAEYSFRAKNYHSREFPIHAIRLSHTFNVNLLGQHYAFTNPDNIFLSFKRHSDYMINYTRSTVLEYIMELDNHLSFNASFFNTRQQTSRFINFIDGFGKHFGHYNETGIKVQLRYAPGEKVYQQGTARIRINEDSPVFQISHTYAPASMFGNMFCLSKTEGSITKRFWFSAFGYLDGIIKGGKIWSATPFPDLEFPNANLSYTIQPESFALLNPMEFAADSYLSWDVTYWANGAIFNYIPVFNKLKLREVFSFRGVWGDLSPKNNPSMNSSLFAFPMAETQGLRRTPYMEAGVGLDNIFRVLRLDYVWRLSYRNNPGADKGGLRLALHFTF